MPKFYVLGQVARIATTIADAAGAPADPGTLRFMTKSPAGVLSTYTYGVDAGVVRDGAGSYHFDLVLSSSGTWDFRWESAAPNPGADEGAITVRKSRVI